MIVKGVKTDRISADAMTIFELLDKYLPKVQENSVLAITSKVVSLCEGQTVPVDKVDKEELAEQEADFYYPPNHSKYHHHFTIVHDTIVGMAGIDESNGGGDYILLPKDPQASVNEIRDYLRKKFELKNLGVIMTDSISIPLRLGAVGACLAYSGFKPVKDYRGSLDLFGRPFKISQANLAAGLAAAAVLVMGEGSEQTPIAVFEDIPGIDFCDDNPSHQELRGVNLSLQDDLFAPFLDNGQWRKSDHNKNVQ